MQRINPKQYANAIYSLFSQENISEEIISELEMVKEKFDESPSFFKHLQYPKLSLSQKEKDLREVFSDFISQKTYRVLTLLIKNKHLGWLEKIITEIKKIKKEDEQVLDAKIYTPLSLEENQKAKLKSILQDKTSKQIIIHEIIKPEIIGGIKIDMAGTIIDGSIAGQINRLKKSIKEI